MADELIHYEVRDRVALVTIANGKANALSPDVIAGLEAALTRAEDAGEDAVGALVIMGAPGVLSGGFDLAVMRSSAAAAGKLVTDGGALITRLFGSDVPVVIACTGHAVAAGALLLLGADERIGCPSGRPSSRVNGSRRVTSRSRRSARGCTTPTAPRRPDSSMPWWSRISSSSAPSRPRAAGPSCRATPTGARCG